MPRLVVGDLASGFSGVRPGASWPPSQRQLSAARRRRETASYTLTIGPCNASRSPLMKTGRFVSLLKRFAQHDAHSAA